MYEWSHSQIYYRHASPPVIRAEGRFLVKVSTTVAVESEEMKSIPHCFQPFLCVLTRFCVGIALTQFLPVSHDRTRDTMYLKDAWHLLGEFLLDQLMVKANCYSNSSPKLFRIT